MVWRMINKILSVFLALEKVGISQENVRACLVGGTGQFYFGV
jgi:hypothetical protein